MNRASFRDVLRALFPSELLCAEKNANNAHVCANRLHNERFDTVLSCIITICKRFFISVGMIDFNFQFD